MILLPLLILWARTPMHFGTPLRYSSLAAIFVISLMAPTFTLSVAADGYGAVAPPVPLIMDEKDPHAGDAATYVDVRHVREGTIVQGISGSFALIGRRWAFIPDRPSDAAISAAQLNSTADGAGKSAARGAAESGTATVFESKSTSGRSISITTSTNRSRSSLLKEYLPENSVISAVDLPQLHVVENLMLQRVVEAIRADSTDVHWVISGEIKEYFDNNVVLLRTARRAIVAPPQ